MLDVVYDLTKFCLAALGTILFLELLLMIPRLSQGVVSFYLTMTLGRRAYVLYVP
jgi:hypothetical protein